MLYSHHEQLFLQLVDSFTRQCLALETATSFPSRRVTRVLERAITAYGNPQSIRSAGLQLDFL
ncbi:MAG: hypothetical protein ACRD3N_09770 [Terracidiphilus sp.]